jgi:TolB-like protein
VAVLPFLDPDYTPAEMGIGSILYQALTRGLDASRELTQVQLKLKQAPPDRVALGRQVRVVALLAGRILREAGETEVEMQLLDVARGEPFWTRRFAWDATRIMDRGTELANGVLQTLGLSEVTTQRFAGTDHREAYDAWLMGRDLAFTTFRPVDYERSLPYFERAIELDPDYVLAISRPNRMAPNASGSRSAKPGRWRPRAGWRRIRPMCSRFLHVNALLLAKGSSPCSPSSRCWNGTRTTD